MPLPILKDLERLINEHGSATILKEHKSLLETKLKMLEQDIKNLQEENARLVEENREIHERLSRQEQSEDFIEHRGALIKRLAGGGYSETPVCPRCKNTMWNTPDDIFPFECSNTQCKHLSNLTNHDLKTFLKDKA